MGVEENLENSTKGEGRKSSKPLMEKRRRARINSSLNELKSLILEAMKKDSSCYSKLEKADILEMTVRHLRSLRTQQVTANLGTDAIAMTKYRAGFNECASEVTRFLMGMDSMDVQLRARLLSHLASCCSVVKSVSGPTENKPTPTSIAPAPSPSAPTPAAPTPTSTESSPPRSPPSSGIISAGYHYQIVPGTLPNGKVAAVLVPSQTSPVSIMPSQLTPQFLPIYTKAMGDFQSLSAGLQLQAPMRLDPDPFWRPW